MNFVGREEELKLLKRKIRSKRSEQILLYGRRRVGKSSLLMQAIKDCDIKTIHYVCKDSSQEDNLNSLSELVKNVFHEEFVYFKDMSTLLKYVYQKSKEEPIIFIIDEYPFMRHDSSSLDSEFQIAIDSYSSESNVKLFICGSYMDIMKKIIEKDAPLYGRFTVEMKLKPFDYYDVSKMIPWETNENKVFYYSVFGGIPYYYNLLDPDLSVEENIEELLIPNESILENEISKQLYSELSKVEYANQILELIAQGKIKFTELNSIINSTQKTNITYPIQKLQGMDLIEKSFPVNDSSNKKQIRYHIIDNLVLFYYTYLYNRKSERQFLSGRQVYDLLEKDILENFIPHQFEKIATEYLIRKNKNNEIKPLFTSIGRFIYHDHANKTNGEFDIVTKDPNGWISYECKYTNKKIGNQIIQEEQEQAEALGLSFYKYGFVSRSGFEDDFDHSKYTLITLDDLFR